MAGVMRQPAAPKTEKECKGHNLLNSLTEASRHTLRYGLKSTGTISSLFPVGANYSSAPSLDFESLIGLPVPPRVHFTMARPGEGGFRERLTGEPLRYAYWDDLNGKVDVFRMIIAAVAKNKNLQLVLDCDQIDLKQIDRPNNAIIVKQAPLIGIAETGHCLYHHTG